MRRRIFKNGPSLVMTLPGKWVKQYGIKPGDEVQTTILNDQLIISTGPDLTKRAIDLKGEHLDRTLLRCFIRSAYRKGYDEINLTTPIEEVLYHRVKEKIPTHSVVRQEVNHLVGTEITEESNNSFTIKKISTDSKDEFSSLLRRIFLRLINYYKELNKLINGQKGWTLDVFEQEYENIKRSISYTLRIINKLGTDRPRNDPILYHIISSLDLVNDLIKYAVRDVQIRKIKISQDTKDTVQEIIDAITAYYDLFYDYKPQKIVAFSWKRRDILHKIDKLMHTITPDEIVLLHRLGQTIEVINYLTIDTLGLLHE